MTVRVTRGGLATLTLTACCLLALPSVAQAYHDEQTPSLEESAYQLRSKEWLLGPFELGVGLWRFQLATRTFPWILGAALGKALPNLEADFLLLERAGVTLSAQGGIYYVNSNKLIEGEELLHLFLIPAGLTASWRINDRHTTSLRFRYLRVTSDGHAGEDDLEINGATLADNAQLHASWEWRLTKISALLLCLRYLPFQGDPVFQTTVEVDSRTHADVDGTVDAEDMQHSLAGSVSGVWSWKHFNLRAGVGYGALFLAGPGLVVPLKYPYPELTLYWRL